MDTRNNNSSENNKQEHNEYADVAEFKENSYIFKRKIKDAPYNDPISQRLNEQVEFASSLSTIKKAIWFAKKDLNETSQLSRNFLQFFNRPFVNAEDVTKFETDLDNFAKSKGYTLPKNEASATQYKPN